jgi:hypothetical protein
MTTPRRRLVRPLAVAAASVQRRQRRTQNLRSKLDRDREALTRWMIKLRRAFHTVERLQLRIARTDRKIAGLENS